MYYFVSDIHLGAGDEKSALRKERDFVAWLNMAGRDAEAIFMLGDLFDFWFEYRRVVPKGFVRTLAKLADLTRRGVRVVFFTGNHDMWVRDYLTRECGVEIYTTPQEVSLAGKRLFLAHGDNMKIDGQPALKLLNTVFRSKFLRWLFSWSIHPDWAMRFGHWWSGKSRKSHDKTMLGDSLTEPLIEYAREYSQSHTIDCFIFGHMHSPRDFRDGALRVINLGCWDDKPTYAVMDSSGEVTLKNFER